MVGGRWRPWIEVDSPLATEEPSPSSETSLSQIRVIVSRCVSTVPGRRTGVFSASGALSDIFGAFRVFVVKSLNIWLP
jgi:hypothetical protein